MNMLAYNSCMKKPKFPQTAEIENWMVLGKVDKPVVIEVESREALEYLDWTRQSKEWDFLREKGEKVRGLGEEKVLLVFGPSGSGKDVVTETVEKELKDKVVHLSSDWYYGPLGKDNGKTVFINNYDHINSVDWDLLRKHIGWLKQGNKVKAPVYDFSTHSQMKGEFKEMEPKPLIMVSGIMTADKLRSLADLSIGVEADWQSCVRRRIKRDIKERGRTRKQCEEQIKSTVKKGYKEFVKPYLKMIRMKRWDGSGEVMLVDNRQDAETPNEPARINKDVYLERIKDLIE